MRLGARLGPCGPPPPPPAASYLGPHVPLPSQPQQCPHQAPGQHLQLRRRQLPRLGPSQRQHQAGPGLGHLEAQGEQVSQGSRGQGVPDGRPNLYLLDGSSQLTLDLQAEALDVPDEQLPVLTLQGEQGDEEGTVRLTPASPTSAPKARPCPSPPRSPALMPPAVA